MLQKLGIEERQRFLERIRFRARDRPSDDDRLYAARGDLRLKQIDRVAELARVVTSEGPLESDGGTAVFGLFISVLVDSHLHLVLLLQFGNNVLNKLGRLKELDQQWRARKDELMIVRNHSLETGSFSICNFRRPNIDQTYQELIDTHRHLPLRPRNSDLVAGLFRAGEDDLAIPALLQPLDLREPGEELAMVQSVDIDILSRKLGVLTKHG